MHLGEVHVSPHPIGMVDPDEYTGHWWGDYYGRVWLRGGMDVVQTQLAADKVATLLTGDSRWAELPGSQMAVLRKHGEVREGIAFMTDRQ